MTRTRRSTNRTRSWIVALSFAALAFGTACGSDDAVAENSRGGGAAGTAGQGSGSGGAAATAGSGGSGGATPGGNGGGAGTASGGAQATGGSAGAATGGSSAGGAAGNWSAAPGFTIKVQSGDGSGLGSILRVTKNGGGFGTKPGGAKPVFFLDWENGETGYTTNTTTSRSVKTLSDSLSNDGSRTIQSSVAPPGGVGAMRYIIGALGKGGPGIINFGSTPKHYVYSRIRTNFDGSDLWQYSGSIGNIKWQRFWSAKISGQPGSSSLIGYAATPSPDTSGNPRNSCENPSSTTYGKGAPLDAYKNKWAVDEYKLLSSDLDIANGEFSSFTNGVRYAVGKLLTRTTAQYNHRRDWVLWFCEHCGGLQNLPATVYHGVIYGDDSWARVVSSSASTLYENDGQEKNIQVPIAWSDTTVDIYWRPRAGVNHLHVITDDNVAHYVGTLK